MAADTEIHNEVLLITQDHKIFFLNLSLSITKPKWVGDMKIIPTFIFITHQSQEVEHKK